eukprot:PhF_6_TR23741/c0_g1_i2/m.33157/K02183/CALM; calmodulin
MDQDYYDFEHPANADTLEYFQGIFKGFDKAGENQINSDDLGTAVRMAGLAPTDANIADWVKAYDPDGHGKITYENYLEIIRKAVSEYRGMEALKEAFRALDPTCRGLLTPHEIKFLLTNFGDKLSLEEITEFLNEAQQVGDMDTEGNVNYESFSMKLLPEFLQ